MRIMIIGNMNNIYPYYRSREANIDQKREQEEDEQDGRG